MTFVDLDLDETQLGGSIVWTEPEDTTQVRGGVAGCGWVGWGDEEVGFSTHHSLSISVTHVLALVTSVLALACWHLLQCIFDLLPLNIYSWGHHPLKCFFKALANALETVAALMGHEANAFF